MAEWMEITDCSNISNDSPFVIELQGKNIAIFKIDTDFIAILDRCPHMDMPLSDGVIDNNELMCIHHGARFCLKTGKVLAAPAFEDLTLFPIRVTNGKIEVFI